MTDYFDALIRSSGLVMEAQPRAPVVDALPGSAASVVPESIEADVERVAAHEPLPVRVAARHESPKARAEDHPSERNQTSEVAGATSVMPMVPSMRPASNAIGGTPAPFSSAPASPVPPVPVQDDLADRGQMIVRAALEWVAGAHKPPAREQLPTTAVLTGLPRTPATVTHVDIEGRASHRRRPHTREAVHPPDDEQYTQPSSARVDRSTTRPSRPPRELPSKTVNPARIESPEKVAAADVGAISKSAVRERPRDVEEVVEVSIGAIHVRVDAPAAQTPPTVRPVRREPPRVGSREALRRRALRRI